MKCRYRNCDVEVEGRKRYCCYIHKWKENQLRLYEERNLPPKYKRNQNYFYMSTAATYSSMRGQGRRRGGLIKGGMSARVLIEQQQIAEVTIENIRKHFEANGGYRKDLRFCDETTMTKKEIELKFNIELN